jgi:hypothetical protein
MMPTHSFAVPPVVFSRSRIIPRDVGGMELLSESLCGIFGMIENVSPKSS